MIYFFTINFLTIEELFWSVETLEFNNYNIEPEEYCLLVIRRFVHWVN